MKLSKTTLVMVCSVLAVSFTVKAQDWGRDNDHGGVDEQKMTLAGTIFVSGAKPVASTDIAWADQTTGLVVFSDRSNAGVDVIDGRTDLFVGRATTNLAGTVHFGGVTSPTTHEGPNGVVTTPDQKAWAGDGDSSVKVVDLDPSSPNYLSIIATISTAGFGPLSTCSGGPSGTCNRADELAYDSEQNIVAAANDEPVGLFPYLTFISAAAPYPILGQLAFQAEGAVAGSGLEQPVWDSELHAFLQTVPETDAATGTGSVVVFRVHPKPFSVTIVKTISMRGFNCSPTGEALAPNGHLVVACGIPGAAAGTRSSFPLVIDVSTEEEVGSGIDQVGGGDEVNYNPGENEFVVSANVDGVTAGPGNPLVLGVINAESGNWINNAPPATPAPTSTTLGTGGLATSGRAGNLAALGSNKRVFVIVHPATAPATDICGGFGGVDYGCVAVFVPTGPGDKDDHESDNDHHDDDGR
jgi:hypothetical protein